VTAAAPAAAANDGLGTSPPAAVEGVAAVQGGGAQVQVQEVGSGSSGAQQAFAPGQQGSGQGVTAGADAVPQQQQQEVASVPTVLLSATECQHLAQQACELAGAQGHQPRLSELLVEPTWKVGWVRQCRQRKRWVTGRPAAVVNITGADSMSTHCPLPNSVL
jgi:hypothetical protein